MSGIVLLVVLFVLFAAVLAVIAFVAYRRVLRRAKGIERGLKMVPLLIHLPPPSDDTENTGTREVKDVMREKVNQAQVLYDLIAGTAQNGFKSSFYGQRHIAFEIIANNGLIHFFAAVPVALVSVVEQAVVTAYPGARLEEVEDHNIFNPQGKLTGTVGGELILKQEAAYPVATIDQMEQDPLVALENALSKLQLGDGAAVQIMLRPANPSWIKRATKIVAKKRHTKQGGLAFSAGDVAKAAVKTPEQWREQQAKFEPSKLEEQMLQAIEEKTKHPAYEVLIRVIASSPQYDRSQIILRNLVTAFALFEAPGSNGFQFVEGRDMQGLVTAFIFRFFPPELRSTILNSQELAAMFHLPDSQFTPTTQVQRQQSKQVDGPVNMSPSGLLLGYNFYRGVRKEVHLGPIDRRRHTYIVGQTGTGKSTILENMAVQDMLAGNGFAFIDPHGDTAEKLVSMVPKERAEDVIYFNPGDMEHPLGLNLFEFSTPEQKDFLIQESINMLYKLYDPGKTGIIGPRFEHWYRNAALTLMADPNGASFIELPKVFTDSKYLKNKFKYLNDPTVIDFWTKEMGQTSDYHKSEMLGWFVSKFGAFQTNEMMRNIIGQRHSAFDMRDIMDNKKILIVNLGKGSVGELNSQLLGMIFVIKFQAAAMGRANIPEDQREDFCLYVDEFQNFSTDSFASILSEARKYRLNLIVANQFIGQLTDQIRDAVFGNVGTIMSYRTGPEDAEFLVKQFEPVFDERDLVNLPNFNAVMKLLVGGLPSQPFSITALPPLGQPHPEMGLAVKQLSAAKFGHPRAEVEADIFARLQGESVPPSAPTPGPAPTPAPAPATNQAAVLPGTPMPARTEDPAPSPAPAAADGLSLAALKSAAPVPKSAPVAAPVPDSGGIATVVTALPPKPAPTPTPQPLPAKETKPIALIEAHETDGKPAASQTQLVPTKLIEAHETDGKSDTLAKPPQNRPVEPKKAVHPEPKPAPTAKIAAPAGGKTMIATHKTKPIKPANQPQPADKPKAKPAPEPVKPPQASYKEVAAPHLQPGEVAIGSDGKVVSGDQPPAPIATVEAIDPAPEVKSNSKQPEQPAPNLQPGEVYIDASGKVAQG